MPIASKKCGLNDVDDGELTSDYGWLARGLLIECAVVCCCCDCQ